MIVYILVINFLIFFMSCVKRSAPYVNGNTEGFFSIWFFLVKKSLYKYGENWILSFLPTILCFESLNAFTFFIIQKVVTTMTFMLTNFTIFIICVIIMFINIINKNHLISHRKMYINIILILLWHLISAIPVIKIQQSIDSGAIEKSMSMHSRRFFLWLTITRSGTTNWCKSVGERFDRQLKSCVRNSWWIKKSRTLIRLSIEINPPRVHVTVVIFPPCRFKTIIVMPASKVYKVIVISFVFVILLLLFSFKTQHTSYVQQLLVHFSGFSYT